MTEIGLNYVRFKEDQRSNLAREAETKRANEAKEAETHRTNVVNEGIKQATLDETIRANEANESIKWATLEETITHNRNTEAETHRTNKANEREKFRSNWSNELIKIDEQKLKYSPTLKASMDTINRTKDSRSGHWIIDRPSTEYGYGSDGAQNWVVGAGTVLDMWPTAKISLKA